MFVVAAGRELLFADAQLPPGERVYAAKGLPAVLAKWTGFAALQKKPFFFAVSHGAKATIAELGSGKDPDKVKMELEV